MPAAANRFPPVVASIHPKTVRAPLLNRINRTFQQFHIQRKADTFNLPALLISQQFTSAAEFPNHESPT